MAKYPQHLRGFSNDTSAPAAQQISDADKLKNHSVTGGATPGTIKLCDEDDKVWGSIQYEDSGEIVIADMGEDIAFKNAGTAAIPIGSNIVGATRTVNKVKTYGYVKAFDSASALDTSSFGTAAEQKAAIDSAVDAAVEAALKAKGTVVDGGGTSKSGEDVSADVEVAFSRCD